MGRISIELVPRSGKDFIDELELVKNKLKKIDTINIPDILKFDMRIPEACEAASPYFKNVIPHVRAVSVHKDEPFPYIDLFKRNNITELLVILGDNPEIVQKSEHPCTSVELIKKIKLEAPHLKVYAGLDQWRAPFEEEYEYIQEKMSAGCDGFFTQPFFDLKQLNFYASKMEGVEIFWGLAPVIRESARNYWQRENGVVFPENFECTLEWNRTFAREVLKLAEEKDFHIYFCPITVDIMDYLKGLV